MTFSFRRTRPALSSQARWMPFELLVALRFLREGRMQSALILAGVTGGVAVIIFLTQLINQLQGTIIDTGALATVETMIADYAQRADRALAGAPLGNTAVGVLRDLAVAATRRVA